ncbi:hypothetical protein, partial [Bacteroides acidifaciens]|uniref:hypothetical protein n=1 Tax=Bacteroides acidifaciens TaxID=85831 RepID=UPI0025B74689
MSILSDESKIRKFSNALNKLSNNSEVESALNFSGVSKEFAREALKNTKYSEGLADAIGTTSEKVGGLIPHLQKAGGALAAFATTPVGFLTIAGASIVAIAAATSETINYEEALEQSLGSIEKAQKSASSL